MTAKSSIGNGWFRLKRASVGLLALLLVGCQGYKLYDGPDRSRAETVEIFLWSSGQQVTAINGKSVYAGYKKRAYVLPGPQVVDLKTDQQFRKLDAKDGSGYYYVGIFKISFEARAGYTYLFSTPGLYGRSTNYRENVVNPYAQACVYEELTDDPKANTSWTNEFRTAGPNAKILNCSQMTIRDMRVE